MNKQLIEDNIMARIGVLAKNRKACNKRENIVMIVFTFTIVVAMSLMILFLRRDNLQVTLPAFHIQTNPAINEQWSIYYPLIAVATCLAILAFITYAVWRRQTVFR